MVALQIKIDRIEIKMAGFSENTVRQVSRAFSKEISFQASELLRNIDSEIVVSISDKLDAGNLYVREKES